MTKIYVKLPSVPAVVTMTSDADATKIVSELKTAQIKSRKIGSDIVVVEEGE